MHPFTSLCNIIIHIHKVSSCRQLVTLWPSSLGTMQDDGSSQTSDTNSWYFRTFIERKRRLCTDERAYVSMAHEPVTRSLRGSLATIARVSFSKPRAFVDGGSSRGKGGQDWRAIVNLRGYAILDSLVGQRGKGGEGERGLLSWPTPPALESDRRWLADRQHDLECNRVVYTRYYCNPLTRERPYFLFS